MREHGDLSPPDSVAQCDDDVLPGIEDLREKREEILKTLREDDAEKAKIQQDLQLLTKRLAQVNDSIARKVGPQGEAGEGRRTTIPSIGHDKN